MAFEDIEKLKARLEKDPESKLFVPLAEEYRKVGMYDEAIDVLRRGLQWQPGYTTARVSLGKIYLEKGQMEEAIKEFEKVIGAVPDNLFAQKKLAEINHSIGNTEKALEHYQKVLELNPLDEEVRETVNRLLGVSEEAPEAGPAEVESSETAEEAGEELEALEAAAGSAEEGEPLEAAEEVAGSAEESPEPEGYEEYERFTDFIEEEVRRPEEIEVAEIEPGEGAAEEFTKGDEETFTFEDVDTGSSGPTEEAVLPEWERKVAEADDFIRTEQFGKAIELYAEILGSEPDNNKVKQRVEELKFYLRLIGKDTESLISQLEGLLQGFKNRRDELFGSS